MMVTTFELGGVYRFRSSPSSPSSPYMESDLRFCKVTSLDDTNLVVEHLNGEQSLLSIAVIDNWLLPVPPLTALVLFGKSE